MVCALLCQKTSPAYYIFWFSLLNHDREEDFGGESLLEREEEIKFEVVYNLNAGDEKGKDEWNPRKDEKAVQSPVQGRL